MNTCPICNSTLLPPIGKNDDSQLISYCQKVNEHAAYSIGEGISHFRIYKTHKNETYSIFTMQNFLVYSYSVTKVSHIYILDEARSFYNEFISDVKYIEPDIEDILLPKLKLYMLLS